MSLQSQPPSLLYELQASTSSSDSSTTVSANITILNDSTDGKYGNTVQIRILQDPLNAQPEPVVAGMKNTEDYGTGHLQSGLNGVNNAESKMGMRGGYCAGGSSDSKESGDYGLPTPPATPFNSPVHNLRNEDIEVVKSANGLVSPPRSGFVKGFGAHPPVCPSRGREEGLKEDCNGKEERVSERKYRVRKGSEGKRYRRQGGRGGDFWPQRRNNVGKELFPGMKEERGCLANDRKIWGGEWRSDGEAETEKGYRYPDGFVKAERHD
ncbi:hypothetical protein B7494_g8187 [Chlorociboria aeruginascens]|nr:hypothetical protein B7494_g8187 [Chlorociboria aeruginascens]